MHEFEDSRSSRPQFTDLVEFLEKQVKIVSDSEYSDRISPPELVDMASRNQEP